MNIDEALQDVQTIKTVAAGLPRKRDGIYVLLTAIYRVGRKWLKPRVSAKLRDAIADHEKIRIDHRTNNNVFRFLVEVASPLDIQQRSRYTNALRYAWLRHCPLEGLTDFIKGKGGIEECAKNISRIKRKFASSEHHGDNEVRSGSACAKIMDVRDAYCRVRCSLEAQK